MLVTRNGVESVAGVHSWVQKILTCTGKAAEFWEDLLESDYLRRGQGGRYVTQSPF